MKKAMIVLGSFILVAAVAATAFSWGPGSGKGRHMKDFSDRGQAYNERYCAVYEKLTEEQKAKIEELDRKFYDDTVELRDKLRMKTTELGTILNDKEPDVAKAKALQKEISDLRGDLDAKKLDHQIEARKIVPDMGSGCGYGRGVASRTFEGGPGMGFNKGMRGSGPGPCWN